MPACYMHWGDCLKTQWTLADAKACSDELLRALTRLLPEINWEEPETLGENGVLLFVNAASERVSIVVSRQALERFREGDEAQRDFQVHRLGAYIRLVQGENLTSAFIGPDHLAPAV